MPNNDSHQHVVKTSAQWNERAVEYWIVPRGCLCIELMPDGKTKIKIGEGNKYYAQLPYITSEADLTQYYTKEEINILFENLNRMAIMSTDEYDDKEELPLDGNKLGDVRFVKSSSPSIKIDPDIYLWNGTKWIFVGYEFKDVDLSKYLKKEEFHELFDPVKEKVDEMYPKMHTHSNKEVLDQITAPFTIPEKEKLAGLENYDDTEIRELIHESSHTHDNKDILDAITNDSLWSQSDRDKFDNLHNYDDGPITERVEDLEEKAHTHANKEFLDTIIYPYQIWSQEDREKFESLSNPEVFIGTDGQYPGRKGLVPAPAITDIGKFLSSSGHWLSIESSTDFVGATVDTSGVHGLVPAPMAGQNTYFLKGDGTWSEIKTEYEPGDGISIEPPEDVHHQGVIHNDGVLDITQDDPDHMNILTVHTRNGTTDIEIPSGQIDDIYTELVDPNQFVLLHDKPADWNTNWNKYFSLSHDLLEEEPLHFNPTKHWKRVNDNYVAGEPGDTFDEYEWYDKHYVGLPLEQCPEFETDLYYSGDLQLLTDGESLATSFGKLNDTIQHVQHIKHSMVSKNELSDVAFSGDYDDLIDIPVINGQTVAGVHPSLYYHIAATYFDTTEGWDDQPDLISEEKALYFYTDYHVAEGIPGVKLGDGVTPLKDLPVFNPTCKVTDEDIDNWNDKVGAVMSEIDPERLILYRNKGDVQ